MEYLGVQKKVRICKGWPRKTRQDNGLWILIKNCGHSSNGLWWQEGVGCWWGSRNWDCGGDALTVMSGSQGRPGGGWLMWDREQDVRVLLTASLITEYVDNLVCFENLTRQWGRKDRTTLKRFPQLIVLSLKLSRLYPGGQPPPPRPKHEQQCRFQLTQGFFSVLCKFLRSAISVFRSFLPGWF